jgi:hypothetical protein
LFTATNDEQSITPSFASKYMLPLITWQPSDQSFTSPDNLSRPSGR